MRSESRTSPYRTIRLAVALGLGVLAVFALPSMAAAKDRNHDRIPDRWEKRHNLSLKVKQTRRDQDGDHLKNLGEFQQGTNPRKADTDNDGLNDGQEVAVGDDPTNDDSDSDGTPDGSENAGTVGSFDGTTLTINLAAGKHLGLVTDGTEISCESEGDNSNEEPSGSDRHGHLRLSSDSGDGESNPGDDGSGEDQSGDPGEDQSGDDDGGSSSDGEHGDGGTPCTVDDLVEGTVVHQAEISVSGDGAVFNEIELIKSASPTG